jgi:hypothetical protein
MRIFGDHEPRTIEQLARCVVAAVRSCLEYRLYGEREPA